MNECKFDGCDRHVTFGGLCRQHNSQKAKGKSLTPIRRWRRQQGNVKECIICEQTKDLSEFYQRKNGYYNSECNPCMQHRQRMRVIAAKNKNSVGTESTSNLIGSESQNGEQV